MSRKHAFLVVLVASLLVLANAAMAQTTDVAPDAYVRGTGVVAIDNVSGVAVPVSAANYAEFSINVSQVGTVLYGGFKWSEYNASTTPTATAIRPIVIVSKQITGVVIDNNQHAVVTALGYYMNLPAKLTFDVANVFTSTGMKQRITVSADSIVPDGSLQPVIHYYGKAGIVVKGSVAVFKKLTASYAACGSGSIPRGVNVGSFNFKFTGGSGKGSGYCFYQEYNPLSASPTNIPVARIELRMVTLMNVDSTGKRAYIEGTGTLNGLPAKITIDARDLVKLPSPLTVFDYFAITATPTIPTFAPANYSAAGPVTRGDISITPVGGVIIL